MASYRTKLTEIKDRLEEILDNDNLDIDENDLADELDEIMDSLDEVHDMFESNSLNAFDENLYKRILKLREQIVRTYDFFDPDIERERMGYYDDDEDY